jgi:murein DD-endopeptidase / murein LD-carboxypeptidase
MNAIERRARELVGARFRLHGRDPATGLDCLGLVACATGVPARTGYPLRGGDPREIEAALVAHGFLRVLEARPGDVLMLRPGAAQLHLAVRTSDGFVHADAALRQVVERPGAPDWEVLGIWRRLS